MTTTAPRFAGLQKALAKISARTADEKQRMRAAANGEAFTGRLATTRQSAGEPIKPAVRSAPVAPAKTKPAAAAEPAKREPWKVPADVEAQGATAAAGYRVVFEAVSDQLGRMAKLPAAEGRIGSLIHMVAGRLSDAEIKSKVGRQLSDRDRAVDAMWAKAHAHAGSPFATPMASTAPTDRPLDGARARMSAVASSEHFAGREKVALAMLTVPALYGVSAECVIDLMTDYKANARSAQATMTSKADAVWDRARASVDGSPAASPTASKPAVEAKSRSAEDVWTRAYAAVAR